MRKFRFIIKTGFINCEHEVEEEFDDDVTKKELNEFAENLVWEFINVDYSEIKE